MCIGQSKGAIIKKTKQKDRCRSWPKSPRTFQLSNSFLFSLSLSFDIEFPLLGSTRCPRVLRHHPLRRGLCSSFLSGGRALYPINSPHPSFIPTPLIPSICQWPCARILAFHLGFSSESWQKYFPNGRMSHCEFSVAQNEHIVFPSLHRLQPPLTFLPGFSVLASGFLNKALVSSASRESRAGRNGLTSS